MVGAIRLTPCLDSPGLDPGIHEQRDQITVTGTPAIDGSLTAYVRTGTLPNGKKMVDTSKFVPDGKTSEFVRPR